MSDLEFTAFAVKYSKAALWLRKKLPQEQQVALLDVVDTLAEGTTDHAHRVRPMSRDGKILLYSHPRPPLEVTYELDSDNHIIYFLHFVAPALQVVKPVFISYSHKDVEWLNRIRKWLTSLEKRDLINIWDDREIQAGALWKEEIEKALKSAKAAVLLVSQNFITSEFICDKELPALLEASRKGGVAVLWIAVSLSSYEDTELRHFQAVNSPERPLDSLPAAELDKALQEIYRRIKQVVES